MLTTATVSRNCRPHRNCMGKMKDSFFSFILYFAPVLDDDSDDRRNGSRQTRAITTTTTIPKTLHYFPISEDYLAKGLLKRREGDRETDIYILF